MTVSPKFQARVAHIWIVGCCVVLLVGAVSPACTSFCLPTGDGVVMGRNYDWHLDHGLVIVNKRGVPKRGLLLDPSDTPAEWVSKYGSVTFNQYGREMPCGGMNEAGLVLETMWLDETRYPGRDARPAVIAWLQYHLDNHATIDEVIAGDKTVRPAAFSAIPVHYLACDRRGNVATLEFLDGKLVCHKGDTLPVTVLANDTYEKSLAYLKGHAGFGGTKEMAHGSWASLDRFACAADRVKKYRPSSDGSVVEYAFDTLASVAAGDNTKWSIVYDPGKSQIHYKTLTCSTTRTVRLGDCDFDPRTPVQVISINTGHTGLLNPHFYHYDTDLNRWLVYYSMKHTSHLAFIPDTYLEILVQYPEVPAMRFLADWEVAGPYAQEGQTWQELFDIAFDPEMSGSSVEWRALPMSMLARHPAYLDLAKALKGGTQQVAYLRARIETKESKKIQLEIYSDDGVKAWLNGQLVHRNNLSRAIPTTPDKVEVTLKEGANDLMLKVTQNTGPWGAVVRYEPIY